MDTATIENMIKANIPDAQVQVRDVRGDGQYFSTTVVSGEFEGLTLIQQHRRVHLALETVIGNDLPAVQITTRTAS